MTIQKAAIHADYLDFLNTHHRDSRTKRATETELGTFLKPYIAGKQRSMVDGKREPFCTLKATRRMPGRVGGGVWVDGLRVG